MGWRFITSSPVSASNIIRSGLRYKTRLLIAAPRMMLSMETVASHGIPNNEATAV